LNQLAFIENPEGKFPMSVITGEFGKKGGLVIQCSICPFGHVCLRFGRACTLHFDRGELAFATECLGDVLKRSCNGFSLGDGAFCASRAADGFYYLVCRDNVILHLSEKEAGALHTQFSAACAVLDQRRQFPLSQQVM